MAKKTIERLIDDLDGGDATETIHFAYDGTTYTIDLNTKNATKLRRILEPYVENGELAVRRSRLRVEDTTEGRAAIRTWARTLGGRPELADRGRIPGEIIAAYRAANRR